VTDETNKPKAEPDPTPEEAAAERARMEARAAAWEREQNAQAAAWVEEAGKLLQPYIRRQLGDIDQVKLPLVDLNKKGAAKIQPATMENIATGLALLGVKARVNMMDASISFTYPTRYIDPKRFGTMADGDIARVFMEAVADCFARVGIRNRDLVKKLIVESALTNRHHPMLDLVKATRWDGQDHFAKLVETVQAKDQHAFAIHLRRWLIQTVECFAGWEKRQRSQKALALVFVGAQGIGKSRWFTSLVPEGMARGGVHLNLGGANSRDSKHEALKQLVTELGEIATTTRKTDVADLKAFLADDSDSYRLPYGAVWTDRPRCTSFAGSTNDSEPLVDTTGNRRFLVYEVERCNPDHGVDLVQLWAQVHGWWQAGEQWWLTPEEEKLQQERNERHTQSDAVAEQIEEAARHRLAGQKSGIPYWVPCGLSVSSILRLLSLPHTHPQTCGKATKALNGLKEFVGIRRDLRAFGGPDRSWVWWVTPDEMRMYSLPGLMGGWQNSHQGGIPKGSPTQNSPKKGSAKVHDIHEEAAKRAGAGEEAGGGAESAPPPQPSRTSSRKPRKPRRPS